MIQTARSTGPTSAELCCIMLPQRHSSQPRTSVKGPTLLAAAAKRFSLIWDRRYDFMDGSPGGGADPSPSWNSWILILKIGRSSIRVSQSQGLTTMPSAKLPAIGGKANMLGTREVYFGSWIALKVLKKCCAVLPQLIKLNSLLLPLGILKLMQKYAKHVLRGAAENHSLSSLLCFQQKAQALLEVDVSLRSL